MKVTVEFSGLVRSIIQEKTCEFALTSGADFHLLTQAIAERFPILVGAVITPSKDDLLNANVYTVNGDEIIRGEDLDCILHEGDHILLLSIIVGG